MSANPYFRDLFLELSARKARFIVVGAHAVMYYTSPRYTKDIDVWVEPSARNARLVYEALASFGAPLHDLTQDDLATPGVIFQIGVEPNRIDILTQIEGLSFERAWTDRVATRYGDVPIFVLSKDDVLDSKRRAGRPQDLLDIERLEASDD